MEVGFGVLYLSLSYIVLWGSCRGIQIHTGVWAVSSNQYLYELLGNVALGPNISKRTHHHD